ncbi:hypothetical protein BZA05DRAFT_338477 [Tricharina praecox]|uniref:uncharacterized protein n=1 Tax=Tricharina praecox TaxID=43433 RepID=UPI00221F3826|nr:uncharacterized protein BZA05DRAFT_338477 [Tricharina praecox]KAI5850689.1 hypothetical protein BZA05DRAFT_338477 [Tricharina praecox]
MFLLPRLPRLLLLITVVLISISLTTTTASPTPSPQSAGPAGPAGPAKPGRKCMQRLRRRAWQVLTTREKKNYINAELCLMSRPAQTGLTAAVTRFDDLIKAHQVQAVVVHGDGWFLPFHRLIIWAHEKLLREECGYKGTQPYWEQTITVGRVTKSSLLSPTTGFGGGGSAPDYCIVDGPFTNYTLHTGPGHENTEHCITRRLDESWSYGASASNVSACLQHDSYAKAWPCLEFAPHFAGHNSIGGEMANPISSPGDPLFYLHHAWLDKLWWNWQARDLPARLVDIAGYTSLAQPATGWVNATLDDALNMFGIVPNATVREVMDIGGDLLCAEYVEYVRPRWGDGLRIGETARQGEEEEAEF